VLGIDHGKTAALASLVARQSAMLPSFEHAQRELNSRGLDLPLKEVRRIATHLGAQVLTRRKRDLLDYREGRLPAGQELAGKRVACCIDAGKSRLRKATRRQKGKGKGKKQQRRYKTDWREVKLLTIYEIDAKGQKVRTSRPWIDGTFAGPDEAMELLAMHLHRLGAAQAEVVVFLADGAPWIWERLEWVVKRVALALGPGLLARGAARRLGPEPGADTGQGAAAAVPEAAEVAQGRQGVGDDSGTQKPG